MIATNFQNLRTAVSVSAESNVKVKIERDLPNSWHQNDPVHWVLTSLVSHFAISWTIEPNEMGLVPLNSSFNSDMLCLTPVQ